MTDKIEKRKEKQRLAAKARRAKDPERYKLYQRSHSLLRLYGITIEQYDQMVLDQNGVCAICEQVCSTKPLLSVDHDHNTGKVRGLLCIKCNTVLGIFKDRRELLLRADKYLEEHGLQKVVVG